MSNFTKIPFSGSTDGRGIKVVATAIGSGTTIHTATADLVLPDVVTIFASNPYTASIELTLGWGGTTDPDDLIVQTVPLKSGLSLVVLGMILRNSLVIKAAASVANHLTLFGYVDRIS